MSKNRNVGQSVTAWNSSQVEEIPDKMEKYQDLLAADRCVCVAAYDGRRLSKKMES